MCILLIYLEAKLQHTPATLYDAQHLDKGIQHTQAAHHIDFIAIDLTIDQNIMKFDDIKRSVSFFVVYYKPTSCQRQTKRYGACKREWLEQPWFNFN